MNFSQAIQQGIEYPLACLPAGRSIEYAGAKGKKMAAGRGEVTCRRETECGKQNNASKNLSALQIAVLRHNEVVHALDGQARDVFDGGLTETASLAIAVHDVHIEVFDATVGKSLLR